jgi:xanthine dehydrogenase YagS FAD-binding subunit
MSWNLVIDEPQRFELLAPASIEAAVELADRHGPDAALLAGGCDLLDQLKHQWRSYRYVINLKTVGGLRGIREEGGALKVGTLTTLAELAGSERIRTALAGYAQAASRVATPQIRNLGTAGGNLLQDSRCPYYRGPWSCYRAGGIVCDAHHGINLEHAVFGGDRCYTVSPSDTAPMLVALDAVARVHHPGGREERPLADLFVAPGENIRVMHRLQAGWILTELLIPLRAGRRSAFVKYAMREAWDFAAASVAVAFLEQGGVCRECRVVLGGVAPIPWRSRPAEAVLEGRRLSASLSEAAAAAAVDGAAPLAHNGYKVALIRKGVSEALAALG